MTSCYIIFFKFFTLLNASCSPPRSGCRTFNAYLNDLLNYYGVCNRLKFMCSYTVIYLNTKCAKGIGAAISGGNGNRGISVFANNKITMFYIIYLLLIYIMLKIKLAKSIRQVVFLQILELLLLPTFFFSYYYF